MNFHIDLFSDTNTNPSLEMRQFMCQAEVGNEVAGEDPTVNILIEKVCSLLGKEKAMFLPSGSMCNAIAYRTLCKRPGDQIIIEKTSHPLLKSSGLIGGLVHANVEAISGHKGMFYANQLREIIEKPKGYNLPISRIVSLEQTTNFGGGAIWPYDQMKSVCDLAHEHALSTHLDGARLMNAVVETNIPASQYADLFDSVWIDFSKSLGAPMGAVLAGNHNFIEEAWYYKFQMGGGMHQAGILAAGCLFALENHLSKLKKIHENAKYLGGLLKNIHFLKLDDIESNIIWCEITHPKINAYELEFLLKAQGIRVYAHQVNRIRMITHLDITKDHVIEVYETIKNILLIN